MKKNFVMSLFISAILFSTFGYAQKKEIVAYFPQWGVGPFPYHFKTMVDNKSLEKITVINYAFAEPKPDSLGRVYPAFMNNENDYIKLTEAENSIDGIADNDNQKLRGHFNQILKLKKLYPNVRVVISIGGWAGSAYFSDAALTEETRNYFVDKSIDLFIKGNLPIVGNAGGEGVAKGVFDGIDLDWEYPVSGGLEGNKHNPNDNVNMTKLLKLFREKLNKIDKKLLLTVAYPAPEKILNNYNISDDQKYLDWFTLMTYDYKGDWDSLAGHHTNILSDNNSESSLDKTVKLFLNKYKVPASKIIPGAAFYGRFWKVHSKENNGLYQKACPGEWDFINGFKYNDQIVYGRKSNYKKYWDVTAVTPYAFNEKRMEFWTFDDEQSIALKALYVDANNLRGLMFWEITGDTNSILVNAIANKNMLKPEFKKREIELSFDRIDKNYKKGDNILLNVKLSDNFNPYYVEFVVNGKAIGTDTLAPYNWLIFNAKKGKHKVKVVAYDEFGNKFESVTHTINVK